MSFFFRISWKWYHCSRRYLMLCNCRKWTYLYVLIAIQHKTELVLKYVCPYYICAGVVCNRSDLLQHNCIPCPINLRANMVSRHGFVVLFTLRDVIVDAMASQITGVSIVYSIVSSGTEQRKHQSSASWPFWGESTCDRWTPLTKGQ